MLEAGDGRSSSSTSSSSSWPASPGPGGHVGQLRLDAGREDAGTGGGAGHPGHGLAGTAWPHGGVDGAQPALLGAQGEVLVVGGHGVDVLHGVGRHHVVVPHGGGHPGKARPRPTGHVVRVTHLTDLSHGVALGTSGEPTAAHVLPSVGGHRAHGLVIVHWALVSLLGHVHLWTGVGRRPALATEHPGVRVVVGVVRHPHVDTRTSGSDWHVAHTVHAGGHRTHHIHPRVHILHHLHLTVHPAHPIHVVHPAHVHMVHLVHVVVAHVVAVVELHVVHPAVVEVVHVGIHPGLHWSRPTHSVHHLHVVHTVHVSHAGVHHAGVHVHVHVVPLHHPVVLLLLLLHSIVVHPHHARHSRHRAGPEVLLSQQSFTLLQQNKSDPAAWLQSGSTITHLRSGVVLRPVVLVLHHGLGGGRGGGGGCGRGGRHCTVDRRLLQVIAGVSGTRTCQTEIFPSDSLTVNQHADIGRYVILRGKGRIMTFL